MTIILFLVDTSSSMCQKAFVGGVQKSYLDIAKGAVETFLKYRQRTQDCLGDRYMLLTFEEPPANVKAGWKENHATFMNELKNLQSTGLTTMGESLKNAFDLLNLNRMQSGIDTYGQGRCPFYLEPSVIIVITDGGRYSYRNGIHQDIILPLNTIIPGTKFTKEPFRWDQRLFSLVLRMSGNKIDERMDGKVPHDDSPIERMCEVTGGRSYRIRSQYILNQCIESLVQKVQPGVVLHFEPILPKENNISNDILQDLIFQPLKKMIYVQKHITQKTFPIGFWPLPEPYWPDPKATTLPSRDAHPKLKIIIPAVDEPQTIHNFPVDKYEIEASPLTLHILQKRELKKCWQVIICNGMHGFELPFGYLKASSTSSQVHLYVLAYNYPALLPLLHDLIHKYNMSPPNDLMYKFNTYVRSIPAYYCPFLRKALLTISVPYQLLQFLLPENVDNYLSPTIANQLKHIKNTAKQDQENLCMKVYKQLKQPKPPYRQIETSKLSAGVPLRKDMVRHPLLKDTFAKMHGEIESLENYTIVVPQLIRQASAKSYRNPFDIPRRDIIEEIGRMRDAFLKPQLMSLIAKDSGHCLPIAEMGNYQEYLKNKDHPLREIEPTNVRQHMFGNPYKKDRHMVMVDEADLSDVAPIKNGGSPGGPTGNSSSLLGQSGIQKKMEIPISRVRKRKAGPLRMDYVFRRTQGLCPQILSSTATVSVISTVSNHNDVENDDNISEFSCRLSEDGDRERTAVGFSDFSDEETIENYFPLNGYVRDFINGMVTENNFENSSGDMLNGSVLGISNNLTLPVIHQAAITNCITLPVNSHNHISLSARLSPHTYQSGIISEQNILGVSSINMMNTHINLPPQQHTSTNNIFNNLSTNTTGTIMSNNNYNINQSQNDINDAQEISRILQQCHNGSTSNTTSGVETLINENIKFDVELPIISPLITNNLNNINIESQHFDLLKRESNIHHINKKVESNDVFNDNYNQNVTLPALTTEQREQARKHNMNLRTQIFRDIRRPGRNYTKLLEHLNQMKGDMDMKSTFIQMCIGESLRFRRKQMVNSIQDWWEKKQDKLTVNS